MITLKRNNHQRFFTNLHLYQDMMMAVQFVTCFLIIALAVSISMSSVSSSNTTTNTTTFVDSIVQKAESQYQRVVSQVHLGQQYPSQGYPTRTTWSLKSGWVSGFFPGILWQLYEHTKHEHWKAEAIKATLGLSNKQYDTSTHDIGFTILGSFGEGYRLTGNSDYTKVIVNAANHLAQRFNSIVGCTRSWGNINDKNDFLVIVDNMMNMELFLQAYKLSRNETLLHMAMSHANRTAKEHVRSDYSSFHVVNFNQTNGDVIRRYTKQGYSDSSCWSRGQAWLIYGFTTMYTYTGQQHYLEVGENLAKYFIAHLPEDGIPPWDFSVPHDASHPYIPRDVSAGTIAACGLFALHNHTQSTEYLQVAHRIVRSLGSAKYMIDDNPRYHLPALLANSTVEGPNASPTNSDVALIYADYYFLKALAYLKRYPFDS